MQAPTTTADLPWMNTATRSSSGLPTKAQSGTALLLVALFLASPISLHAEGPELVRLESLERPPLLEIRYATPYNFTHTQLYPWPAAWLHPAAANALLAVQQELEQSGLGLKVFDAYRPLSVQQKMWDLIQDERYVSNPARNQGRHTRGTAVDVTLVDKVGNELPMPTGFDDFTEKAHRDYDGEAVSTEAKVNRAKLAEVMQKHGFLPYSYEWWHFDLKGWEEYPVLDVDFIELDKKKKLIRTDVPLR